MCDLYHIYFVFEIDYISDRGPDNWLTYISVQLLLICLFLKLDLNYLCAGRTAPYHSWRNPVERIMSGNSVHMTCCSEMHKQF